MVFDKVKAAIQTHAQNVEDAKTVFEGAKKALEQYNATEYNRRYPAIKEAMDAEIAASARDCKDKAAAEIQAIKDQAVKIASADTDQTIQADCAAIFGAGTRLDSQTVQAYIEKHNGNYPSFRMLIEALKKTGSISRDSVIADPVEIYDDIDRLDEYVSAYFAGRYTSNLYMQSLIESGSIIDKIAARVSEFLSGAYQVKAL